MVSFVTPFLFFFFFFFFFFCLLLGRPIGYRYYNSLTDLSKNSYHNKNQMVIPLARLARRIIHQNHSSYATEE